MTKANRFASLETVVRERGKPKGQEEVPAPDLARATPQPQLAPESELEEPSPRKVGRKRTGKRSNPDFQPVTVYVRVETYDAVHDKLTRTRGRRAEISDLVQELFEGYLDR